MAVQKKIGYANLMGNVNRKTDPVLPRNFWSSVCVLNIALTTKESSY